MPKVSVIMPVYNAVKYLEVAIDSILNQTFGDFELILIDDGATDGSSDICKKYASINNNIIYLKQSNQGISAARNKGLEVAKGDYIAFSDHDDEYDHEYIKKLYGLALETNADIIKCGVIFENVDANCQNEQYTNSFQNAEYCKDDILKKYFKWSLGFFDVWNGIYKKSFLQRSNVKFDTTMKYGQEDFMFNIQLIPHINKVVTISDNLYRHYRRVGQSTSAKFKKERLDSIFKFYQEEIKIFNALANGKYIYEALTAKAIASVSSYIKDNCATMPKSEIIGEYISFCENLKLDKINGISVIKNRHMNYKRKLILILAKKKKYSYILSLYGVR